VTCRQMDNMISSRSGNSPLPQKQPNTLLDASAVILWYDYLTRTARFLRFRTSN